jgi:hypothetical protein
MQAQSMSTAQSSAFARRSSYASQYYQRYKHDDDLTSMNSIRFRPLASVWSGRVFGYVRNAFSGELQSNRNLPTPDCRFPAPDVESSMVKLVALLTTFSAGIFLVYAIEAYGDKAYRAHFSETHDLGVTKTGSSGNRVGDFRGS